MKATFAVRDARRHRGRTRTTSLFKTMDVIELVNLNGATLVLYRIWKRETAAEPTFHAAGIPGGLSFGGR